MKDMNERNHAMLSPSAAYRWTVCPRSVALAMNCENRPSEAAQEGTLAHEYARAYLTGEKMEYRYGTDELLAYAEDYSTAVLDVLKHKRNARLLVEEPVDISEFAPGAYGYVDAAIMTKSEIILFDFKSGAGVKVNAEKNTQMMMYALGLLKESPNAKKVTMTIYQPRMDNVSTWHITVKSLLKWAETYLTPRAILASRGEGEFVAGDHCQFCPARAICREHNREIQTFPTQGVDTVTDAEIEQYLPYLDDIIKTAKEWQEYAVRRAVEDGVQWQGMRLTTTPARRQITDKEEAVRRLRERGREDLIVTEPATLAALEKGLKGDFDEVFDGLIMKTEGKPTLKPIKK